MRLKQEKKKPARERYQSNAVISPRIETFYDISITNRQQKRAGNHLLWSKIGRAAAYLPV